MILLITIVGLVSSQSNDSNNSLNFSQVTDNVKEAQLFLFAEFISSLNHINATEEVQKEDVNFLYQIWYNMNYTIEVYHIPLLDTIIDQELYKENMFPETDEWRTKCKNYLEEWKGQTDEDKSIVLQSIFYQAGNLKAKSTPICQQIYNFNQTEMIEANNEKKKINAIDYIIPVPWQHTEMSQAQYMLSRFIATAYEKNITIEEALKDLPFEEQWLVYSTFCDFFGIKRKAVIMVINIDLSEDTQQTERNPSIRNDPIIDPAPPTSQSQPLKHEKKQGLFLYAMGFVSVVVFFYYLALKIRKIIQMKKEEKSKTPLQMILKA